MVTPLRSWRVRRKSYPAASQSAQPSPSAFRPTRPADENADTDPPADADAPQDDTELVWSPRVRGLSVFLAAALAFLFSYGPGAYRMRLDVSLLVAVATGVVIWLAAHAPRTAFSLAVALSLAMPVLRSSFQAMEWIVLIVAVQVLLTTELSVPLLAFAMYTALTVNDAWLRVADGRTFLHPSVLGPAIVTMLAVGLGVQGRRLRRANAELRRLRERDRQLAALEERRRLARDVHDEVAHHASAIAVRSELALQDPSPIERAASIEFAARTAQELLRSLRRALELLDEDAEIAMHNLLRRMGGAGLNITMQGAALADLPPRTAHTVIRVMQEALTNVLRHRGPGACWISLDCRMGAVELVVEDDGLRNAARRGVDAAAYRSHGLAAMRERAAALGGKLSIGASPRGGWRLSLRLPAP